jgi:CRISPR-associated protein Csm2
MKEFKRHRAEKSFTDNKTPDKEIRQEIEKFIDKGLKNLPAENLIKWAEEMGKFLVDKGLKTTQIRKFLDSVRKLDTSFKKGQEFNSESVILLKPKLAYAAGRQSSVKPLMNVLEPAITAAQESYESFKKLLIFIESIVAYHKFHEGKDS